MKNSLPNFLKVADEKHEINFRWPSLGRKIIIFIIILKLLKAFSLYAEKGASAPKRFPQEQFISLNRTIRTEIF